MKTYEHICTNKPENLGKMDKFLEKHNPRRKENLNSDIRNKELLSVIKSLPTRKILGPDGFTDEFNIWGTNCINVIQNP